MVEYMRFTTAGWSRSRSSARSRSHTWGAHAETRRPIWRCSNLDPYVGLGWERTALAAFAMRRKLHDLGSTAS